MGWSMVSFRHMRSFGCKVYCPIDKKYRGGKLGAVRYEGVLVGYSENSPTVRVWNLLGPLPIDTSASLVSTPIPHLCASSLVSHCASIECY